MVRSSAPVWTGVPHSWRDRMNYYLKAWLSAATLPVWLASACWFDAVKLASAPLKPFEDARREE